MRNKQRAKLAAEGVKTGYGARVVLSEVAFELHPGEVMALLGPNGAGKSTLLKSAAGQLALQGGSIYLEGKDLQAYSGRERAACMALLFTERREPEFATAREVVEAGRYPYTGRFGTLREQDHAAVARAMAYVRTEELRERPFAELSDGQRQRVLLARALAQEPRLILLDEPTAFLDLRHKIELLGLLRDLATREGLAVLVSLHEPDLALKCADRVLLVADGKVLPPVSPEEALSEENMRRIYGLSAAYDALSGSAELPRHTEYTPPDTLVLAGGGSGIPVYRRLRREGVSFAAGIFSPADLDYPVAIRLAAKVIETAPYEPVSEVCLQAAKDCLSKVGRVIWAEPPLGSGNMALLALRELAETKGILEQK